MGTRAYIGIADNGSVRLTQVQFEGDALLDLLSDYYDRTPKIRALIEGGSYSTIGKTLEDCVTTSSTTGLPQTSTCVQSKSMDEVLDDITTNRHLIEHAYIYDIFDEEWVHHYAKDWGADED
jgi:hypothetical protein